MILKSLILSSLLILTLTYEMKFSCVKIDCPANCTQCLISDGGPFQNITTCVDATGGCLNVTVFNITIGCENGCGLDCAYKVRPLEGVSASGCLNDNDLVWTYLKASYNQLYKVVDPNNAYNWCSDTCGFTTGLQVAVIIAGVGVAAVAILLLVKCIKRKKLPEYQKM